LRLSEKGNGGLRRPAGFRVVPASPAVRPGHCAIVPALAAGTGIT
jgi:hypothetical protein